MRDLNQAAALSYGINRTAETVAIDTFFWETFYQGAVYDQFSEGAEKPMAVVLLPRRTYSGSRWKLAFGDRVLRQFGCQPGKSGLRQTCLFRPTILGRNVYWIFEAADDPEEPPLALLR